MPKKMGVNSKAEAARERRSAAESERRERQAREKEDRYWQEAEGPKSRAAKKREENVDKRLEAAARRADNRRLAEQEQADLDRKAERRHRVSAPVPKVTVVDLERRKEEERQRALRIAEEAKKRQSRTAEEEDYHRLVLVANTNRDESVIDARSVDEALAKISLAADSDSSLPRDRHPERRLKATFKTFEEAELPKLKEDKPGLTLNQYKDMIWKMWKKSPDNPLNQVAE